MPTCRDCRHYRPLNRLKGDCMGYEVRGAMDARDCPVKGFEPRARAATAKPKAKRKRGVK